MPRNKFNKYFLRISFLAMLLFFVQNSATAQTALEQQCFNDMQSKVAWNRAGNKTWNETNLRFLCRGTTNPGKNIACYKTVITLFDDWDRGLKECSGLATSFGNSSYEGNPYSKISDTNFQWNGGTERTIYNPLDGGILLKYSMTSQRNADGCSGGASREKTMFQQACLAHDTNYDAPFPLAGFPGFPGGGSSGQEISDYLFYKDMQLINANAKAKNDGFTNFINDSAADSFYAAVVVGGNFRGNSTGKTILAKGGVVAVTNLGAYVMNLKVKWTDPNGVSRTAEINKPVGTTATIPLSIGAKNIEIECSAVAGKQIFKRSYAAPGMYAFTVSGTTFINSVADGLKNDARNTFQAQECDKCIKFTNEAGYVADMIVMYFVNQDVGGTKVMMPKTVVTDKITVGVSKSINIPKDIAPNTKINIHLRGYGTMKNEIFSIVVEPNFSGQKCYKAWGTIFSPQGGKCN